MRKFPRWLRQSAVVCVLALFCLGFAETVVYLSSLLVRSPVDGLENQLVDLAFQVRPHNDGFKRITPDDVVIIDIDDESIRRLGRVQSWPRLFDAWAISHVASGNPRAIGIDYLYTEPDSLSPAYELLLESKGIPEARRIITSFSTDDDLARAISDAGIVYLSFFDDPAAHVFAVDSMIASSVREIPLGERAQGEWSELTQPVWPIRKFAEGARAVGSISMPTMNDGTIRHYRAVQKWKKENGQASLVANFPVYMVADCITEAPLPIAVSAVGLQIGNEHTIPLSSRGEFRLNWLGSEDSIRYIPWYKVVMQRTPAEFFQDKYVFFGTSASGLQDLKTVPSQNEKMPGVEVHAVAFLNMANGAFVREVSAREAMPWFLILSVIWVALFMALRPLWGVVVTIIMVASEMVLFVGWFFPTYTAVFPIVTLMILTFMTYLITSLYIYFIRERKSRRLKYAFGSYVSPEVVEQIIKDSSSLQLGGEKKTLTVLFSDIRGFTSYSEKLDPQQIVTFLNRYLSRMSDIIFRHRGTIDKFIGDAIMAIFGAPVPQPDHAEKACRVALDMCRELRDVNRENELDGHPPVQIGIGINTGDMTVGNIGSLKRFDYTVIGDAVNLGSRLEGLTKFFGVEIIVSEDTRLACKSQDLVFRELGEVKVKGKDKPVSVWHLVAGDSSFSAGELQTWERAFQTFRSGNMDEAHRMFSLFAAAHPGDLSVRYYQERCAYFIRHPEEFSLVIKMESK